MHNIDCIRDWDWEGISNGVAPHADTYYHHDHHYHPGTLNKCQAVCSHASVNCFDVIFTFFSLSEFPEWAGLIILSPATGLLYCLSPGFHLLAFPCNQVQLTSFYALMLLYLFQNFQKTSFLSRTQSKPSNPSTFECVRCFFICDDIYFFL